MVKLIEWSDDSGEYADFGASMEGARGIELNSSADDWVPEKSSSGAGFALIVLAGIAGIAAYFVLSAPTKDCAETTQGCQSNTIEEFVDTSPIVTSNTEFEGRNTQSDEPAASPVGRVASRRE